MSAKRFLRFTAAAFVLSATLYAQPPQGGRGGPQPEYMRQAQQAMREGKHDDALGVVQKELATNPNSVPANNAAGTALDLMGTGAEARRFFQSAIDAAPAATPRQAAQLQMEMSCAFEGDCRNAVKYEQMAIAYWVTREVAKPRNAF